MKKAARPEVLSKCFWEKETLTYLEEKSWAEMVVERDRIRGRGNQEEGQDEALTESSVPDTERNKELGREGHGEAGGRRLGIIMVWAKGKNECGVWATSI